jgi:DNA-binding response OmpR family regulator
MTAKADEQSDHSVARLLIIADDPAWEKSLRGLLKRFRIHARSVASYDEYLFASPGSDDVDMMLIRLERVAVERIIERESQCRATSSIHIIVMAVDEVDSCPSHFLDMGADDYFHISYEPAEIISRLHAIRRRRLLDSRVVAKQLPRLVNQPAYRFSFHGWILDCTTMELSAPDGRHVPLTKGECRVLSKLVSRQGQAQTRESLSRVLGGGASGVHHRAIDTAVSRLRRKLAVFADDELIQTVPREGYRLAVPALHISDE